MAQALKLLPALLLFTGIANAQPLADPTRPPASLANPATAGGAETARLNLGPQLQSVLLRQGARSSALISGQWVEAGQKVGDATLVKVSADRVLLRGPGGTETLRLMPDVDKRAVAVRRPGATNQGTTK